MRLTRTFEQRDYNGICVPMQVAADDLDAAMATLREKGVRFVDEAPRPGAHGSRIAFIHPTSAGGLLVELKQKAD